MAINRRLRNSAPPHHIDDVLITEDAIEERVDRLVTEMVDDCRVEDLVLIGILRGSFMFLADLVRALYRHGVHPRIDFMTLASYGAGTTSSGKVAVRKDISVDVDGAYVILVDDILDTGRTLDFAIRHLRGRNARSISTCVLLDKPERREIDCRADHVGFEIENVFVVGYGLDYDNCYRELPYIAKVTFEE